ncbi:cell wall/surface repeat protein [Alkaliphilus metalliredigens QYMF]|uniref:Cell wall/surface repeat protein n=1 Tax=Alkaliphilus metalliredigens (strain QYMF) TaxID=293826 RepID=A6TNF6_ALKMQ|nr:DUF4347 domain-containing protein [Alkaliphilus metalliredigens]ABR47724.1 cell wall/surface repeat protein [Alkaliphilus metalliredigens QYMF]
MRLKYEYMIALIILIVICLGMPVFATASVGLEGESTEVAIVDTSVQDYKILVESAKNAGLEVILIGEGEGVKDLAEALEGRSNIDALHIFSHGDVGQVFLGGDVLSSETLEVHANTLARIGASMTATGHILLYGCNVAQGEVGSVFIEDMARITQADVAASNDPTGAAALGGDWVLEEATGEIKAEGLFVDDFNGLLANAVPEIILPTPPAIHEDASNVAISGIYVAGNGSFSSGEIYILDNTPPTVTPGNISVTGGSGTGGAYIIGDTVTVTWDNTAGGDNNADVVSVTVDFSELGGGAAVVATNNASMWKATYNIVAGALNGITNRNVVITATDHVVNVTTVADNANVIVDNVAPGPVTVQGGGTLSVSETAANGAVVGTVISSGAVTYSLVNNGGGRFAIDAATGEITVADAGSIVYAHNDSHSITVVASDAAGNMTADTVLTVTVTDASPVLAGTAGSSDWQENTSSGPSWSGDAIYLFSGASVTSIESNFAEATLIVSFTDGYNVGDFISFHPSIETGAGTLTLDNNDHKLLMDGQEIATISGGNMSPLVITFNHWATATQVNAVFNHITFTVYGNDNPTNFGANATRAVSAVFQDAGSGLTSNPLTGTLTIIPYNDPEILNGTISGTFTEGTGTPLQLVSGAELIQVDNINFDNGSLMVSLATYQDGDVLGVLQGNDITLDGQNLNHNGINIGTINTLGVNGTPLVINLNENTTHLRVQDLIDQLVFESTSQNPTNFGTATSRSVTISLDDGAGGTTATSTLTGSITINDLNNPPEVDLNGAVTGEDSIATFLVEGTAVLIAPEAIVIDWDNTHLSSLTATLANRPNGNGTESLGLSAAATTAASGAGLYAYYTEESGILSIQGAATVDVYQTILRGIQYHNGIETMSANTADRVITIVASDGEDTSISRTATVSLVTAPIIGDLSSTPVAHVEDGGAVLMAAGATIVELDGDNLNRLLITLTNPQDGVDEAITLAGRTSGDEANGITITYTSNTVITLTGIASASEYQALLRELQYANASSGPETATVREIIVQGRDEHNNDGGIATVQVQPVNINNAPVLVTTELMLTSTNENTVTDPIAVSSFLDATDDDRDPLEGIVITEAVGNGEWEYSTGGNWSTIDVVNQNSALLLRSTDYIRYVPDGQNGETVFVTYRAWDQTSGTVGTKVDVTNNGGTTAFSTNTATATLTVMDVNDAPVLNPTGVTLTGTDENTSVDFTVESFIESAITDVDIGAVKGTAITATSGNGVWQYSTDVGATWISIGAVNDESSLLLNRAALIRYVPDGVNGETASITYRAWDQTSGTVGTKVDVTNNGGTTAFSTNTATATLIVTDVNDAPILISGNYSLGNLNITDIGTAIEVDSFIDGAVTDVDNGALKGIAIVDVTGNGTWQYSTDGFSTWSDIIVVSESNALLLRDSDYIRYIPGGIEETAEITYRAWDKTSGVVGGIADTTANGGTTAFSTALATASINAVASTEKEITAITIPAGATIEGTNIIASVANATSSVIVDVTVSPGAYWTLYSDEECAEEIVDKTMNLYVGTNTAYIKVTAQDGTTKTYTAVVSRGANPTYTVIYDGNGSTDGTVPTDSNNYEENATVTVLGNTGNLMRTGYTLVGWNTQANGQGTSYYTGSSFTMGAENATLYAKWIDSTSIRMTANPDNVKGNINFDQTFILNLSNDTVTGSVYADDINLGDVFSTLNISSVNNSSNTVTLAVYGSLSTQGIGTISLNENSLNNSTTPLIAEVVVSLNTATYHGNGETGGSIPTDSNVYEEGATVTVLGNTGNLVKTGYTFAGWNTQANGQETSYTQGSTLIMSTTNINLYAMWTKTSSGGGSSGGSTGGNIRPTPTPEPATETEEVVIINGEAQTVGKETVIEQDGEKIVELRTDSNVLSQKIDEVITLNQTEGIQGPNILEIPVSTQGANQIRSVLTGDIIKKMEDNQFILIINTEKVDYVIPVREIDIEKVADILNVDPTSLHEIEIEIRITYSNEIKANEIIQRGRAQGIEVIMQPMEFEIVAKTTNNQGEEQETTVNQFTSYVSRVMEVPSGVDPNKITTGILYNPDGSFTHIPTNVFMQDNKWYVRLNSLTNSTYTVIWNPITVAAVENHWSKETVNDMASRLVIKNPDTFKPNQLITRGEFAEYITKALGIYLTGTVKTTKFSDVPLTHELSDAITIATDYGIISGYPDGTFKPDAQISREEAMTMYAGAMDVVDLQEIDNNRIHNYIDKDQIATWAYESVKKTVSAGVFSGRTAETINPKDTFTYAEAATAIRNLLVRAGLIND